MEETNFENAYEMLTGAKSIAIVGHIRPDGDTVGCCVAMRLWLAALGKKADIFIDSVVPETLNYITERQKILRPDDVTRVAEYDVMLIVDCSDERRIGECAVLRPRCKNILCFDHHLNNTVNCDLLVCNTERASCGEVVYEFFVSSNIEITKDMATALFTAVSSDTGCFLYPNTTDYTHLVASELIKTGIDREMIMYYNFRVYDPKVIKGLSHFLRSIRFVLGGRVAVTVLDYKFCKKFAFDNDERHKFQKYAVDADGVRVSAFLTEESPGEFHVSLRSHGENNVALIAEQFGGGGHKNAAGFTIKGKAKNVVKTIIDEIAKTL